MYPAHLKEQEFPFRGTTLICSEYRCRPVLKISSTFQEIRFKNQGFMKTVSLFVNFQRFPTLDAKKLVNAPKMSAHHRGICHF